MGMKWFFSLLCISTLQCSALTVTTNSDSGPGSLRQAVIDAADGDTIDFAITGQIVMNGGELLINKNLTIVGPGSDNLTLVGGPGSTAQLGSPPPISCRLFNITNPSVSLTISDLWIRGGHGTTFIAPTPGDSGGAVYNAGTLQISRCVISDSRSGSGYNPLPFSTSVPRAGSGGAILNNGTLYLISCTISNNAIPTAPGADPHGGSGASGGSGGAICNFGNLTMMYCTVNNNTAGNGSGGNLGGPGGSGGGIYSTGTANIIECTIAQNLAGNGADTYYCGGTAAYYGGVGGSGGGIFNSGTLTVDACTISGNTNGAPGCKSTPGLGGGICFGGTNSAWMINSIVANNMRPGAVGDDVSGDVSSLGNNLVGLTNGCVGFGTSGDLQGTSTAPLDPKLSPLGWNGGPTPTLALQPGSPAIDAGDNEPDLVSDQRGFPRVVGAAQDIGAFESGSGPIVPPVPFAIRSVSLSTNGACRFSFNNRTNLSFSVFYTTDLALPANLWDSLGKATETSAGHYEFIDLPSDSQRYYQVRWP